MDGVLSTIKLRYEVNNHEALRSLSAHTAVEVTQPFCRLDPARGPVAGRSRDETDPGVR
jgi:hypothetical protein